MSLSQCRIAAMAGLVLGLAGASLSSATTVVLSLDRQTGERVGAARPAVDGSGLLAIFESTNSALVPDDTNGDLVDDIAGSDIFLRNRESCTTTRISVDSAGHEAVGDSIAAAISLDGTVVSFLSTAALVPEDHNGVRDVYSYDVQTGTIERVNVSSNGCEATSFAHQSLQKAPLSRDGRFVGFTSYAGNLATPPVACDARCEISHAFLRDRTEDTTTLLSVDESGVPATSSTRLVALSSNGAIVAMITAAPLVSGDGNELDDLYLADIASGALHRANLMQGGEHLLPVDASLSEDGCRALFSYRDSHTESLSSVALYDCAKGYAELVDTDAFGSAISADGRFLAYAGRRTDMPAGYVPVRLDLASLTRVEFTALAGPPTGEFGVSAHGETVVSAQFGSVSGAFIHGFLPHVPAACESIVACESNQAPLDMAACALTAVASSAECRNGDGDASRGLLLLAKATEWLRSAADGSDGASSKRRVRHSIKCLDQAARRVRQDLRKDRMEPLCATELEQVRSVERSRLKEYLGHLRGP